jgi:hypothetical protein
MREKSEHLAALAALCEGVEFAPKATTRTEVMRMVADPNRRAVDVQPGIHWNGERYVSGEELRDEDVAAEAEAKAKKSKPKRARKASK